MATFVCIHGAGGRGSYWDLVAAELRAAGHEVVAMDLPCDDDSAGLAEYTDAVVDAIGDRRDDLVLVAQSLGGFTAPLVAERVPVGADRPGDGDDPAPGETGSEWWGNTGVKPRRSPPRACPTTATRRSSPTTCPPTCSPRPGRPATSPARRWRRSWPLAAWPDVPTRFLLCMDDRFFPPEWMRGVVRDRLGIEPDEIPGGHCAFLSQPKPLAAAILRAASAEPRASRRRAATRLGAGERTGSLRGHG